MSIIQKIFSALNADEKQAVKTELAQAELKEGTTIEADSFEEGQAVFIVTEDGEKIPMPEGTYELEDGRKVEVNDSSMIVSIGTGEEEAEGEAEAEVEQEAKEEMEEKEKEEMSEEAEELKEDEKEEMTDMDKLREELRQYVREVVMEAMQEKEEMSSEETTPEAAAEETEEKAEKPEEVAVEASAQKVSAKIKVKPEGTRPDSIDWFKPQMRSTTMGNVFKHLNK